MSNAAIKAALDSSVESASDLLVLVLLADHLNGKTGLCCPSIPLLAEECRRDERSIFRALKRLEEQGHISRDSGRGVGHSNRYRIHPKGERKRRAKPEPDSPSDEEQNLTPVSPFDDGEKVTNQTVKPDASVMQKVTELVSKPDTSVTLTRSNQKLTGNEPEVAPIESASASSHFTQEDDDEILAILRRLGPSSAPTTTPSPEPQEDEHEEDPEPYTEEELFDHFEKTMWELYPSARKSIDQRPDFTRMLRDIPAESRTQAWKALKAWNHSPNWNNDGGKFVPNVLKFLADKRWTHPPKTEKVRGYDCL